jgi:hypothetical protein
LKRQGSATRSRIDRDGVRVRRNGPIAFGKKATIGQAAFRDAEAQGRLGNTAAREPSSRRLGHPRGGVPQTVARDRSARGQPGTSRPRPPRARNGARSSGIG